MYLFLYIWHISTCSFQLDLRRNSDSCFSDMIRGSTGQFIWRWRTATESRSSTYAFYLLIVMLMFIFQCLVDSRPISYKNWYYTVIYHYTPSLAVIKTCSDIKILMLAFFVGRSKMEIPVSKTQIKAMKRSHFSQNWLSCNMETWLKLGI